MHRNLGISLIEMLVALIAGSVVLGGVLYGLAGVFAAQNEAYLLPLAQTQAMQLANTLASDVRQAQIYSGAPVLSATATSIDIFTTGGGVNVLYSDSGGVLTRTFSGGTTTQSGVTLALTYFQSSSYNASGLVSFTPASSTYSQIIAVGISVTVTVQGYSATYNTLARMRNCPVKTVVFY